jgi:hypothetical protein
VKRPASPSRRLQALSGAGGRLLLLFAALLVAGGASSGARAETRGGETCAGGGAAAAPSTDLLEPAAAPTRVEIAMFVREVKNIDVKLGRASFTGYAEFSWCDPRQAFDAELAGVASKRFFGDGALAQFGRMWQPDLTLANGLEGVRVSKRILAIRPDGAVRVEGIFDADIAVSYDLRRFPLDRQVIPIQVESFTWNADQMTLHARAERVGFRETIDIPEWRITGIGSQVAPVAQVRDERPFSRFSVHLQIERESGFYIYKVALPLSLIVMLSWAVFWMKDEPFAGRTRVSLTGVLTIVAYQFAIGNTLPRVPYLTLMDKLMIASFLLIAITVVENLLVAHYQESDPARALRVDRTARWLFPALYAAVVALVVLPFRG